MGFNMAWSITDSNLKDAQEESVTPKIREIVSGLRFPEGPVAMPDGSIILVEIAAGRISRIMPDGRRLTVAEPGGGPNGAAIGPGGKLYVCNNGGNAWYEKDGRTFPGLADTGYSGIWTGTLVELNGTGQTYLRAAGSLGWSFPAALGAKCAAPHRKVVCWSGDGAFYYHLAELETARRRGIAVTVVVNNNSGFGQGWPNLRRLAGNRPDAAEALLRFGPTDFTAVARSFGLRGIRVERAEQIAPALREAIAADETVVVDVVTDIEARAPEAWAPPS